MSFTFTILFATAILMHTIQSETINGCDAVCECSEETDCVFQCNGARECKGSTLICKNNQQCSIDCAGDNACKSATMRGKQSTHFTVECRLGTNTCRSATIKGMQSTDFEVSCSNFAGVCLDMHIYTDSTTSFVCIGDRCGDAHIHSPAPTSSPVTNSPSAAPTIPRCDLTGTSSSYAETIVNDVVDGDFRHIITSGCPNHENGKIAPNPDDALYIRNDVKLPAYPCISDKGPYDLACVPGAVGIALNGVPIYSVFGGWFCGADAIHAESRTFDYCGGHADFDGAYHYHMAPTCLLAQLNDTTMDNPTQHSPQIGWAYDGFPIYGPHGENGEEIYLCDHPNAITDDCLDSCGGHDQHRQDKFKYHYHIQGPTSDLTSSPVHPIPGPDRLPYTIGCLVGVPYKWADSHILQPPHPEQPDQTYPTDAQCRTGGGGTGPNYDPQALAGETSPYQPSPVPTEAPSEPVPESSPPPNFLFIVIDDLEYTQSWSHSYNGLGTELCCSGERKRFVQYTQAATPKIQQFIDDGTIIIPRTYASPMCAPSRFALITGRYPSKCLNAQMLSQELGIAENGTRVDVPFTKIEGPDRVFNIPSMLQWNGENPYYTGAVGKWHLTAGPLEAECRNLTLDPDATVYQRCVDDAKNSGFDFVDAFYGDNIYKEAADVTGIGHNPEWIVQQAQDFIDIAVDEQEKPFFLYCAFTLTHPDAADILSTLTDLSAKHTPKGALADEDIPTPLSIGMLSREEIIALADNEYSSRTHPKWDQAAGTIWVDDAIGALLTFLQIKGIYDNTFIVLMNDHGQGAKGTLFEHGTRIIQFVRYPPLFDPNIENRVLDLNFITHEVDLSAVVFDIVNRHQTFPVVDSRINPYAQDGPYGMDGKSWVDDVINKLSEEPRNENSPQNCCNERYIDIEQSHAIIDKQFQYIWRAQGKTARQVKRYEYGQDDEQLYDLEADPNQQINVIDHPNYQNIACDFKTKMIHYIQTSACPFDNTDQCNIPSPCM